jgi:hypothetical protein
MAEITGRIDDTASKVKESQRALLTIAHIHERTSAERLTLRAAEEDLHRTVARAAKEHSLARKSLFEAQRAFETADRERNAALESLEERRRWRATAQQTARQQLLDQAHARARMESREKRRQQYVAELASSDSESGSVRRQLLTKQVYARVFSSTRLLHQADAQLNPLHHGFQRLRAITGLTDLAEIVARYAGRHATLKVRGWTPAARVEPVHLAQFTPRMSADPGGRLEPLRRGAGQNQDQQLDSSHPARSIGRPSRGCCRGAARR